MAEAVAAGRAWILFGRGLDRVDLLSPLLFVLCFELCELLPRASETRLAISFFAWYGASLHELEQATRDA